MNKKEIENINEEKSNDDKLKTLVNQYKDPIIQDQASTFLNVVNDETEQLLDRVIKKNNLEKNPTNSVNTDQLLEEIKRNNPGIEVQNAGNVDTETFLYNLIEGGKRNNIKKGNRNMVDYSGLTYKLDTETETEVETNKRGGYSDELSQLISNQANEINRRVVKKIMNVMDVNKHRAEEYRSDIRKLIDENMPNASKLDKSIEVDKLANKKDINEIKKARELHNETIKKIMEVMEVGEEEARDYKAALWKMVKEELPNATNLEQSEALLEKAKKTILKKINLKEAKEIRTQSQEKRKERMEKQKMTDSSDMSKTSTITGGVNNNIDSSDSDSSESIDIEATEETIIEPESDIDFENSDSE